MGPSVSSDSGWTLTQEAFDKFLTRLHPDRERAGEEYERLREMLTDFFDHSSCMTPDVQADDSINRVIRIIDKGEQVRNMGGFCYVVARNVLHEYWDAQKKVKALSSEPEPVVDPRVVERGEEELENEQQRKACMKTCKQSLEPEDQDLIGEYYRAEDRKKLAKQKGITINALRLKVFHIKKKLKKCFNICMKRHQKA